LVPLAAISWQQTIVVAAWRDPADAQARRDSFGKRAAEHHPAVDIPRVNGARTRVALNNTCKYNRK
jgi:hypothetical protein